MFEKINKIAMTYSILLISLSPISISLPIKQSVTMPLNGTVIVNCIDGIPYIYSNTEHILTIKCHR